MTRRPKTDYDGLAQKLDSQILDLLRTGWDRPTRHIDGQLVVQLSAADIREIHKRLEAGGGDPKALAEISDRLDRTIRFLVEHGGRLLTDEHGEEYLKPLGASDINAIVLRLKAKGVASAPTQANDVGAVLAKLRAAAPQHTLRIPPLDEEGEDRATA